MIQGKINNEKADLLVIKLADELFTGPNYHWSLPKNLKGQHLYLNETNTHKKMEQTNETQTQQTTSSSF